MRCPLSERSNRRLEPLAERLRPGALLVVTALGVLVSPVRAQRLPVEPGNRVRVAALDSAELDRWREGKVVAATRLGVLLSGRSFGPDTIPIPLDPSIRLQVRRKRASGLVLGTAGGLVLGVGIGAIAPPSTLGSWWGEKTPGHRAEIIYFGLAGAAVGWLGSWLLAPARWQDVPLTMTGVAVSPVPLTRTAGRPARFGRLERWTFFPPTETDFNAFFWAHRDSLHAIEGIWELRFASTRDARIAIVRDDRYPGWEYIALWIVRARDVDVRAGRIIWALRRRSEPDAFDVHETDEPGPAWDATLDNGMLRIRYGTPLAEWVRQPPTPPR